MNRLIMMFATAIGVQSAGCLTTVAGVNATDGGHGEASVDAGFTGTTITCETDAGTYVVNCGGGGDSGIGISYFDIPDGEVRASNGWCDEHTDLGFPCNLGCIVVEGNTNIAEGLCK